MTLKEQLLAEDARPKVVDDCVRLVDREVASKSGLRGFAIKGGYKVVRKLDGGRMVPKAVNDLLPNFADAIEPHYAAFESGDDATFSAYCQGREAELANALLGVTDGKAVHAKNELLKSVYYKLRPMAQRNIEVAIGGLAAIVDRHTRARP